MDSKAKELAEYRLERAKKDLETTIFLYNNADLLSANNRAYYAIFHAIRAVFALERIDFKRHKDVIAHFNQYYINTEVFPKSMGRRIVQARKVREDSDYDDKYIPNHEKTQEQIDTAREIIDLVEKYINEKIGS